MSEGNDPEDFAREALRWSARHQDVHDVPMHAQREERGSDMGEQDEVRLPRISIDLKVPVWAVATATFIMLWGGVNMYFTLQDVAVKVSQMQAAIEVARVTAAALSNELALHRYRLEALEKEHSK